MRFLKDMSLSAVVAGLVAVLVALSSSAVIIFQAAHAVGATEAEGGSWMLALGVGVAVVAAQGNLHLAGLHLALARPVLVMPELSIAALASVAIPLFIVTMASQNVPGVAVLRAAGYDPPVSPLITWTGVSALVLASFGAFSMNLAAIVAAIGMGKDAHDDPSKRYIAGVSFGFFFLVFGLLGATVASVFSVFPKEMILALAGFALLNTIGSGLAAAVKDEARREPAIVTFLITASGLHLLGIGAAFSGIVGSPLASLALHAPLGNAGAKL